MYIHDRSSRRSLLGLISLLDIPRLEATVIDLTCKQADVTHDVAVGVVVDILSEITEIGRFFITAFIDGRAQLFELIREPVFEISIIGITVFFQSLVVIKRNIEHTVYRGNGIDHLSAVFRDNRLRFFGGIYGKVHQRTAVVLHDGGARSGCIALDEHIIEQTALVLDHRNIPPVTVMP